jgi:hypothetical protein
MNKTHSLNTLGGYLETKESMTTEYKEFCFKENIYNLLTDKQVSDMCRKSILPRKFNNVVLYNLCKYIDIYLPKYACSFHNSYENELSFVVGINDFCEVTGIPYNHEDLIDQSEFLNGYLKNTFKNNMQNFCCLEYELIITKCNKESSILEDLQFDLEMKQFDIKKKWYKIQEKKYNKKKKKWVRDILKYKGKLQDVFDDEIFREEFKNYLKNNNLFEKYKHNFINHFVIDADKIKYYKKDPNCFIYWLIAFKESIVEKLHCIKPIAPMIPRLPKIEFSSVTHLSQLRKRWIVNNPRLEYYLVKIRLRKKKKNCKNILQFKDPMKKHWRIVERYLSLQDEQPLTKNYTKDMLPKN